MSETVLKEIRPWLLLPLDSQTELMDTAKSLLNTFGDIAGLRAAAIAAELYATGSFKQFEKWKIIFSYVESLQETGWDPVKALH